MASVPQLSKAAEPFVTYKWVPFYPHGTVEILTLHVAGSQLLTNGKGFQGSVPALARPVRANELHCNVKAATGQRSSSEEGRMGSSGVQHSAADGTGKCRKTICKTTRFLEGLPGIWNNTPWGWGPKAAKKWCISQWWTCPSTVQQWQTAPNQSMHSRVK